MRGGGLTFWPAGQNLLRGQYLWPRLSNPSFPRRFVMFDNLFLLAGPVGTAGILCVALFAVVGVCRVGHRIQRADHFD